MSLFRQLIDSSFMTGVDTKRLNGNDPKRSHRVLRVFVFIFLLVALSDIFFFICWYFCNDNTNVFSYVTLPFQYDTRCSIDVYTHHPLQSPLDLKCATMSTYMMYICHNILFVHVQSCQYNSPRQEPHVTSSIQTFHFNVPSP